MDIIEVNHLKKYFKEIKAVDDISFRVKKGELFAFLGLNGAGKSTTISVLSSQLRKDSGRVIIDGMDIESHSHTVKGEIGIVFQSSALDALLTGYDNLKVRAGLYGIRGPAFQSRLAELARLLDLGDLLKRPVGKLSGGQRRRMDVARALLHQPKILILDEPTTGLDPQSRMTVWRVIDHLRKEQNLTVFLTTHYMEEAGEADYVVILDSGKIVAEGTPRDLKNAYTGDFIRFYGISPRDLQDKGLAFTEENGYLQVKTACTQEARDLMMQYPELFADFEIIKGKMDDVFLAVTGKNLREVGSPWE